MWRWNNMKWVEMTLDLDVTESSHIYGCKYKLNIACHESRGCLTQSTSITIDMSEVQWWLLLLHLSSSFCSSTLSGSLRSGRFFTSIWWVFRVPVSADILQGKNNHLMRNLLAYNFDRIRSEGLVVCHVSATLICSALLYMTQYHNMY